ncbi:MAG TPA: hypothetical protein V6C91_17745, partial [Coleofasciculaceae cyanobacterium]
LGLLKALNDASSPSSRSTAVAYSATEALSNIAPPELMLNLSEILRKIPNHFLLWDILSIISAIQERCGYYNHAIATTNGQAEEMH